MHFPAEVEQPPWGFFMIVGGEGALGVLVQHHPTSPRELAGLFPAQELSHAQIAWEQILWL